MTSDEFEAQLARLVTGLEDARKQNRRLADKMHNYADRLHAIRKLTEGQNEGLALHVYRIADVSRERKTP